MNVLVFICFSWLIVFSFKQVAREATASLSPAVNSNWILKGLETVSSCFVFKYTHLLTVQWTRNFQYCTQLRFVQYWKFLVHCTVSACVYLKTKHSQQSLTHNWHITVLTAITLWQDLSRVFHLWERWERSLWYKVYLGHSWSVYLSQKVMNLVPLHAAQQMENLHIPARRLWLTVYDG